VTFPIPGVPNAIATATLNDKFMAERVVVKQGAKTYEFTYSNYKDWNNPLNPAEAFYAGRMIEKQNGAVVRDITEHGAKLKFSSMVATPDVVELYIPNKDESYRATVQWRNADEIGVGFDVDEKSPPLAPGAAPADWSARIHKLEHDVASLQRKFNELQTALRQIQGAD